MLETSPLMTMMLKPIATLNLQTLKNLPIMNLYHNRLKMENSSVHLRLLQQPLLHAKVTVLVQELLILREEVTALGTGPLNHVAATIALDQLRTRDNQLLTQDLGLKPPFLLADLKDVKAILVIDKFLFYESLPFFLPFYKSIYIKISWSWLAGYENIKVKNKKNKKEKNEKSSYREIFPQMSFPQKFFRNFPSAITFPHMTFPHNPFLK